MKMRDGVELYYEITQGNSADWIIWVHGICEHLGRYSHLDELFAKNFNILRFDLRGHGKSQGKRAYVENFEQFVDDLHEVITFLKTNYKSPKYALMGHSMGGLIVAGYMQTKVHKQYYPQVVFFNSPPAGLPGAGGVLARLLPPKITGMLSGIRGGIELKGMVDLKGLSHDPEVGKNYALDKLNSMVIHSALLFNLVNFGKLVFSKPLNAKCPVYTAVGSEDKVVCPQTIIDYCKNIDPTVKIKVFEGSYHELHNEIDKYRLPFFEYMKECIGTRF